MFNFVENCNGYISHFSTYGNKPEPGINRDLQFLQFKHDERKKKNTKISKQPKIIGGWQESIKKVPYQVTVAMRNEKLPHCGGSIVGKKHVLTAGHCVEYVKNFFLFGSWFINISTILL